MGAMPGAADERPAATGPAEGRGGPRNLVVLLLDSLNRHMLGCYGGTEFETPHLDRFARERAVRFTSHVTGSLPCMPARHDILCGALDFLWRPWGSIEIWEEPVTQQLRRAGVTTMLVSDHPHLFEVGGENYHTDFNAWDYVRGHEGDPWRTYSDPTYIGAPALPARGGGWYWQERLGLRLGRPRLRPLAHVLPHRGGLPGPRTMRTAADWLREARPTTRPSSSSSTSSTRTSPSTRPRPGSAATTRDWEGELLIWPPYDVGAVAKGRLSEREGRQIRANYGAKLSMIDHWVGEVFAALEERGLWDSTAVIVCTDHGHYLGEKDIWGKPGRHAVRAARATSRCWCTGPAWPAGRVRRADDQRRHPRHDRRRVRRGAAGDGARHVARPACARRDGDGGRGSGPSAASSGTGSRSPTAGASTPAARTGDNFPLSMWSNRWSTMPIHGLEDLVRLPPPDRRARLDFMPGSDVPVIRQPFAPGDRLPFWVGHNAVDAHFLFDLASDPDEDENRAGTGGAEEADMVELLRVALQAVEAPDEQLQRLGIA